MYGHGISKSGEIIDLGVENDIVQKSGSWYSYKTTKIAQGRDGAKQFILDNPEVGLEIENAIVAKINGGPVVGEEDKKTPVVEDE